MKPNATPHTLMYVDEADSSISKVRRGGRNLIGKRTTVHVPGQRDANITLCALIFSHGVLCHIPSVCP